MSGDIRIRGEGVVFKRSLSMTPARQMVLDFIAAYFSKHTYAPTVQEISDGVALAMSTTHKHLQALAVMEQISWSPKSKRSLKLGSKFGDCPACGTGKAARA
jgi:SOS-response transcriptional repressor LexA